MLENYFFDVNDNISFAEELFYRFYDEILQKDMTSPNFICFCPSLQLPFILERTGVERPCVFQNKSIIAKAPVPKEYRKVRDRFFPAGSLAFFTRYRLNHNKDTRHTLLESIKPLLKRNSAFMIESRKEGLFDIDSNKKFLTLSSWIINEKIEMVSGFMIPEVTEEMKEYCDEKKYIGFKDFVKPQYKNLLVLYQQFFSNMCSRLI